MIKAELSDAIMELNPEERLDLARQLIESVVQPEHLSEAIKQGIGRIEDVATGRVTGLSEEQYRAAIG
jgi:putative addiction module component (TIGR02574 family)